MLIHILILILAGLISCTGLTEFRSRLGFLNCVNNQLIRTVNKEYFIDNQGLVFLKSIKLEKVYSLNGEPEEIVQFKNYNNKGDLLEVSKKNDINIVYIYGYDKTEVVAKIENISWLVS